MSVVALVGVTMIVGGWWLQRYGGLRRRLRDLDTSEWADHFSSIMMAGIVSWIGTLLIGAGIAVTVIGLVAL